jgi:hypothetical protein
MGCKINNFKMIDDEDQLFKNKPTQQSRIDIKANELPERRNE